MRSIALMFVVASCSSSSRGTEDGTPMLYWHAELRAHNYHLDGAELGAPSMVATKLELPMHRRTMKLTVRVEQRAFITSHKRTYQAPFSVVAVVDDSDGVELSAGQCTSWLPEPNPDDGPVGMSLRCHLGAKYRNRDGSSASGPVGFKVGGDGKAVAD